MAKVHVFLNEQHSLLPDQERILNKFFGEGEWEIRRVPAEGWTFEEQKQIADNYEDSGINTVVFASPVPALLMLLSRYEGVASIADTGNVGREIKTPTVYVLHNDRRIKKQLLNGEIKQTVAQEGWQLV